MVKAVEDGLVHPSKFIYTDTHLQYFEAEFGHDMVDHIAKESLDGRIFRQVLVQQAHVEDLRRDERVDQTEKRVDNLSRGDSAGARRATIEKLRTGLAGTHFEEQVRLLERFAKELRRAARTVAAACAKFEVEGKHLLPETRAAR